VSHNFEAAEVTKKLGATEEGAGTAVLGSQGDVWDAQKDILADTLGAITALVAFHLGNRKARSELASSPS